MRRRLQRQDKSGRHWFLGNRRRGSTRHLALSHWRRANKRRNSNDGRCDLLSHRPCSSGYYDDAPLMMLISAHYSHYSPPPFKLSSLPFLVSPIFFSLSLFIILLSETEHESERGGERRASREWNGTGVCLSVSVLAVMQSTPLEGRQEEERGQRQRRGGRKASRIAKLWGTYGGRAEAVGVDARGGPFLCDNVYPIN